MAAAPKLTLANSPERASFTPLCGFLYISFCFNLLIYCAISNVKCSLRQHGAHKR